MDDDELETLLEELEASLTADVQAALTQTSQDFSEAVDGATELVAARFSVSGIRSMWRRRVSTLMTQLRAITGRAAQVTSDDMGDELPDGWDTGLDDYWAPTRALLDAVGDRLAAQASQSLADGLNAGEDLDQLKARLTSLFADDGTQLGPGRAERIAMTETTRAWNAGTLAAAQALTGPDRPLVKQWITRRDDRVREAHADTNGQLQLLDDPFDVGGVPMQYPGDPTAPASLTVNCFPGDVRVRIPAGLRRVYRHWYEGPMLEIRTADGTELSGTPNHPVLTLSGWQPLKFLKVGDKLIQSGAVERVGPGDPHVEQLPPTFAEVYRAADKLSLAGRIGAGSVNFHGDVPNSDVDVVPVVGHLGSDDEAGLTQELGDALFFSPSSGLRGFLRTGHGGPTSSQRIESGVVNGGLAGSGIGSQGVGRALFEGHAPHTQSVGVTASTNSDTGFGEHPAHYVASDTEPLGKGKLGFPGIVGSDEGGDVDTSDIRAVRLFTGPPDTHTQALEKGADGARVGVVRPSDVLDTLAADVSVRDVVSVREKLFTGHVYNLETECGWYIANDTASHNCRCILRTATAPERTAAMSDDLSAAADVHTGAMIALMPTEEDAVRLALEGGEAVDQLHLTLFYLGEAADWSTEQQGHLIGRVSDAARLLKPVAARAFGSAQWNPGSDEPAWVWNVGNDNEAPGSSLEDAKYEITWALEDGHDDPELPQQYTPWSPHICAVYDTDDWMSRLTAKVGPVTFDRVRVAFAGQYTDIPLSGSYVDEELVPEEQPVAEAVSPPAIVMWSTPDGIALAFENQQTGDGRVFASGALYWSGPGPWPLQYADEMNGGHDGARLAGAIYDMARDAHRITGWGPLYLTMEAGMEAALLLSQGAPLGVSVDLDDVDIEVVVPDQVYPYRTHLVTASILPLPDGGWHLKGESDEEWTASASGTVGESSHVDIVMDGGGRIPADAFQVTASAGDVDSDGEVVQRQLSGEVVMRITRARVRGATLVTIPAYDQARIVLDDTSLFASSAAATGSNETITAGAAANDYDRVVRHVRKSLLPVTASDAATFLKVPVVAVRRYLARAARKGQLVRISRGTYVKPNEVPATAAVSASIADGLDELTASVTGAIDLPVAPRETPWDGDAAATRVFDWADGDTEKIGKAFAYRDDDADPATKAAFKLGYADVQDGTLTIIPNGVSAALGAMNGARGGVDLPDEERATVQHHLEAVRAHVEEETGGGEREEMEASAWSAMRDLPPMPAAWFAAPTAEELPPGGPGVNYRDGRIFGWVAQAGEPHAGYAKKVTIDGLGRIDTSHFLRQRFTLDDGSQVKAGAFTMNIGHHRDGAECETAACQFDDSRTVAGIVTVGMSERGMWFSGAAAPWLSDWDRSVFMAVQPSYHLRKGSAGNWQLRAVLSVPVPGHSSPLLASAVVGRSNLALTAAATMAEVEDAVVAAKAADELAQSDQSNGHYPHQAPVPATVDIDYDRLADALIAASARADVLKAAEAAELEELLAEGRTMNAVDTGTEGI